MLLVNGREVSYEEGMTIEDLLEKCNYTFPLIIVKVNGKLVKKEERSAYFIEDKDEIQVIHMMGGG